MQKLEIEKTALDGVLIIKPPTWSKDARGEYVETYNQALYEAAGIRGPWIQDDISVSKKNVLRGIHGDTRTTKLISCLYGEFYFVVVNWDPQSPQYGKWISMNLSEKNRLQVLVPPKFGNGHLVLSETTIFHYKQTTYYDRASQFTLYWNDPKLGIRWPTLNPILSERDAGTDKTA